MAAEILNVYEILGLRKFFDKKFFLKHVPCGVTHRWVTREQVYLATVRLARTNLFARTWFPLLHHYRLVHWDGNYLSMLLRLCSLDQVNKIV